MVSSPLSRGAALCAALWLSSSSALRAEEPAPTAPSAPLPPSAEAGAPSTSDGPPSASEAPGAPAVSEEERRLLEAALAADAAPGATTTLPLPDLSKMNPAASLPFIQSLNPEMSFLFDGSASWFSLDPPLQTGEHDPDRSGFKLQQLELAVGASVDPFARFDANIVLKGDELEIEEAYATTLALPFSLQARAGAFLTRFGRQNEQHPHAWSFTDQPLVYGKVFGGDNNRGLGAELSWLTPLPWFTTISAAVQEAAGGCCARTFAPEETPQLRSPLDLVTTAVVEQFFPLGDDLSLLWGVSAQTAASSAGRAEIAGTDLLLRYAPVAGHGRWSLDWQTEVIGRARHDVDPLLGALAAAPSPTSAAPLLDVGGYTQLVWRIDPQWEIGARFEYVSGVVDDPLDPDWTGRRLRTAAQTTFYPSHFSRVRLEASVDQPSWLGAPIFAVMAQLEVLIGAHGAHPY